MYHISEMFKFVLTKKFVLTLSFQLLFFLSAFFTLSNYNISWDEPTHFKRGQGYLWYFLTGDNNYNKLPSYNLQLAQNDPQYHQRSIYQDNKQNNAFYNNIDGAHPPLADILSALTNMIFYQKLGLLGDVQSYHLFEIFVSSLGVGILFLFTFESFGPLASVLATIFYATYPLFWAESHFNIKDPIETTWIIFTLYFLWKGVVGKKNLFIFLSSIFAGFALATKFNIVFLPFMVLPWFLKEGLTLLKDKRFLRLLFFYPLTASLILYISFPFLWANPLINTAKVIDFYLLCYLDSCKWIENLELSVNPNNLNWSIYAARWILFTTPPLVLVGLSLGLIFLRKLIFKHNSFLLLILFWFLVPIIRVSIPGTNIYGGVRQIMEYIPAMAILAGVGFSYILSNNVKIATIATIIITIFSVYPLIKLHPNENVYFNFLIGGLKGAVEKGIPAAGNSFGNAYLAGLNWINENARLNSKLSFIQGTPINIPKYKLRKDINLSNDNFSGASRSGEYVMELTYNYENKDNLKTWEYVEKFLQPVYEVKVEGVPILKIWKND